MGNPTAMPGVEILPDRMEWPTEVLRDWAHFVDLVHKFVPALNQPPEYVFRGQANAAWSLVPFLHRIITTTDRARAVEIEKGLDKEFRAEGVLRIDDPVIAAVLKGPGLLERLAFMRHYSVPTRLLDWTSSPYVAAYFAVAEEFHVNGCVFVVHSASLNEDLSPPADDPELDKVLNERLLDPGAPDQMVFYYPDIRALRTSIQQGHFSVNTRPLVNHDEPILRTTLPKSKEREKQLCARLIIPAGLKHTFLRGLGVMNITPKALFPGPDSLGRTLADMVRLDLFRRS